MKHLRQDTYKSLDESHERVRRSTFISRALIIVGVLLLAASVLIAGYLIYQYVDAQNRYRDLTSIAGLEIPTEGNVVPRSFTLSDISINWDALRERNADIVAWVIIPGTRVNYPVVKGIDNDYYLYRLFDEGSNDSGTIFLDYQNSSKLDGKNLFIYGHNMLDGSMFSDLLKYKEKSFLAENQTVFLATPERIFELRAIAALSVPGNEPARVFSFNTEKEFKKYRDNLLAFAITTVDDLDEIRPEIDTLYSFVTCETNDNNIRIFLTAIPVRSVDPKQVQSATQ